MKRLILSIVMVVTMTLLIVGATYAYFSFSTRANNAIFNSSNFDVVFTGSNTLSGNLEISNSRSESLKTTVSVRMTPDSPLAECNLYIDIASISSSLASNALVWEIVGTKNGENISISPSRGTFSSCVDANGDVSSPCQSGNRLYILNDYLLDYVDSDFTVYVWLDGNYATSNMAGDTIVASIGAETNHFVGGLLVPDEYQQVEYIESSGTQYIDTGIIPDQDTSINVKFKVKSVASLSGNDGGAIYSGAVGYNNRTKEVFTGNGVLAITYGSSYKFTSLHINTSDIFQLDNSKNVYRLVNTNTNAEENISFTYTSFEAPYTLWLFALHRGSSLTSYLGSGTLIYNCKILQDDVLVRDFIPVYRKSDNVVGLYDRENDVFYSNENSNGNDFKAGPKVN